MKEIQSNQHAWSQISEEHYHHFKKLLSENKHMMNPYIKKEIGDLTGKRVIHLQCNTGADSILLARMGAREVVGVDLVPDNVHYAGKMAKELGHDNVSFFQCDMMELADKHQDQYDVVFTSEGAIGWLPDLTRWAKAIAGLLRDDGYFYAFDSHPFFLTMDEAKLPDRVFDIKYPYFGKTPDVDNSIGGYATDRKYGVNSYSWAYTVGDLINSLTTQGLHVEWFHEFRENFWNPGGMEPVPGTTLYVYPFNKDLFPMSFSLKATVYHRA